MLINIGFGNVVNMDKVISIVRADAAPVKRMVQVARVLSALQPETIENRVTDNPSAGGKEDD